MGTLLALIGFIVITYGIISLIISVIKKRPKKKPLIISAVGFVVMLIGGSLIDTTMTDEERAAAEVKEEDRAADEAKKKAAEEEKAKAEAEEAKAKEEEEKRKEAEVKAKAEKEAEEKKRKEKEKKRIEDEKKAKEKEEKSKSEPTLPITVNEFRNNFDRFAGEFELPFRSNQKAKVEKGEVYNTQKLVTGSDYVQVFATLTKDGKVKGINFVGVGDGSPDSGLQIIGALGSTIAATQPDFTAEQRGEVLTDLGILGDGDLPSDMTSTVRGKYKYSFSISDVTGIMFFVEPAE